MTRADRRLEVKNHPKGEDSEKERDSSEKMGPGGKTGQPVWLVALEKEKEQE